MSKIRVIAEVFATVLMTATSLALLYVLLVARSQQPTTVFVDSPVTDVSGRALSLVAPHNTVRSKETATVVLVEFSDFQCPYCGKYAHETLPQVNKEFVEPGRVAYAFMHYPLKIHPDAILAAKAAACAGDHGRFWEMHDVLFANQSSLGLPAITRYASRLSLSDATFARCLDKVESRIENDMREGARLGVTSTPTFFIGELDNERKITLRAQIRGAKPYDVFKDALDKAISESVALLSRVR